MIMSSSYRWSSSWKSSCSHLSFLGCMKPHAFSELTLMHMSFKTASSRLKRLWLRGWASDIGNAHMRACGGHSWKSPYHEVASMALNYIYFALRSACNSFCLHKLHCKCHLYLSKSFEQPREAQLGVHENWRARRLGELDPTAEGDPGSANQDISETGSMHQAP